MTSSSQSSDYSCCQIKKSRFCSPGRRCGLTNIPTELQLTIFDRLHPVSSTCLGLTCKTFYRNHRTLHGVVKLDQYCVLHSRWTQLGELLLQWGRRAGWWHRERLWEGNMRFLNCGLEGRGDCICNCKIGSDRNSSV